MYELIELAFHGSPFSGGVVVNIATTFCMIVGAATRSSFLLPLDISKLSLTSLSRTEEHR
jgi:hypothetical protein